MKTENKLVPKEATDEMAEACYSVQVKWYVKTGGGNKVPDSYKDIPESHKKMWRDSVTAAIAAAPNILN